MFTLAGARLMVELAFATGDAAVHEEWWLMFLGLVELEPGEVVN